MYPGYTGCQLTFVAVDERAIECGRYAAALFDPLAAELSALGGHVRSCNTQPCRHLLCASSSLPSRSLRSPAAHRPRPRVPRYASLAGLNAPLWLGKVPPGRSLAVGSLAASFSPILSPRSQHTSVSSPGAFSRPPTALAVSNSRALQTADTSFASAPSATENSPTRSPSVRMGSWYLRLSLTRLATSGLAVRRDRRTHPPAGHLTNAEADKESADCAG